MTEQRLARVFISYSHDTFEHQKRVVGFADRLRADGIDAEIDQYNAAPPEGWPLWCERQIATADVVLMVCTKFVPVLFSDASPEQIPTPIKGWTRYIIDTEDGYEDLYRRLTRQPRLLRPALGTIRALPTRRRQWPEATMAAASPSLRATQKTTEGRGPMEPMSAIVGALSAGAAALASGALSEAGKDAYNRLRGAILRVVSLTDLEKLEQKPNSQNRKGVLKKLAETGKTEDAELAKLAQHMITTLEETGAIGATGFSLEEVEAINLRLKRIIASGPGVSVKKSKFAGDIEATDVSAGVAPGKATRRQD